MMKLERDACEKTQHDCKCETNHDYVQVCNAFHAGVKWFKNQHIVLTEDTYKTVIKKQIDSYTEMLKRAMKAEADFASLKQELEAMRLRIGQVDTNNE